MEGSDEKMSWLILASRHSVPSDAPGAVRKSWLLLTSVVCHPWRGDLSRRSFTKAEALGAKTADFWLFRL
jgi:hypothetical protein